MREVAPFLRFTCSTSAQAWFPWYNFDAQCAHVILFKPDEFVHLLLVGISYLSSLYFMDRQTDGGVCMHGEAQSHPASMFALKTVSKLLVRWDLSVQGKAPRCCFCCCCCLCFETGLFCSLSWSGIDIINQAVLKFTGICLHLLPGCWD